MTPAASLHHNRPWRMGAYAGALQRRAEAHRTRGDMARAAQAAALAEALHWAAGGDRQGVRIALSDAKAYARIKRKETQR